MGARLRPHGNELPARVLIYLSCGFLGVLRKALKALKHLLLKSNEIRPLAADLSQRS